MTSQTNIDGDLSQFPADVQAILKNLSAFSAVNEPALALRLPM